MSKQSWRKRSMSLTDIPNDLPINNPASAVARKESSRSAMAHKMIHLIPVVVVFCFVILWSFGSPVEFETKDGVTRFVSVIKKSQPDGEENDVDVTVMALETPPDDFLTISDPPSPPPLALPEHPKVSLLEIHDENASLTDSYVRNAELVSHELKSPSSVSHEPIASFADSDGHNELLSDSQEPKESFSVSHDVKVLFEDSTEPRISYPETINEVAPQPSGEADQDMIFL